MCSAFQTGGVRKESQKSWLVAAIRNSTSRATMPSVLNGMRPLIEALRTAGDGDRAFRRPQVEAAVRFCGKVFGQDYATLLSKAADVAAHGNEHKAAKA